VERLILLPHSADQRPGKIQWLSELLIVAKVVKRLLSCLIADWVEPSM
jgi:hypothetical protein